MAIGDEPEAPCAQICCNIVYPRESQEMVFDAHDTAFDFFGSACRRGIYDNMTTAVDAIFIDHEWKYNQRFEQMCGHYLVEPLACTPASGWEKGWVENQVGLVRERFFMAGGSPCSKCSKQLTA